MDFCVLCGSPGRDLRATGRLYRVCDACGLIRLDPAHHPDEAAQKARYLDHDNRSGNAGYVATLEQFLRACVDPFRAPPGRALDFGCGPIPEGGGPVLASLLARRGFATDVFDPHFAPATPWRSRPYDLVTMTEVLEHLPDPLATLGDLVPRMAPGGILALSTRFHPRDDAKFLEWWYRRDATHVAFYSASTLERLARALGLDLCWRDESQFAVLGRRPGGEP